MSIFSLPGSTSIVNGSASGQSMILRGSGEIDRRRPDRAGGESAAARQRDVEVLDVRDLRLDRIAARVLRVADELALAVLVGGDRQPLLRIDRECDLGRVLQLTCNG